MLLMCFLYIFLFTDISHLRAFPTYGHPLVPRCPDKKGLSVFHFLPSFLAMGTFTSTEFHSQVDTNNITESFNNVLWQRYFPLRHDTTVFAFVQVLTEVAFPEQESKYFQTLIQQTQAYCKPRYDIPSFLEGRPHKVRASACLIWKEPSPSQ